MSNFVKAMERGDMLELVILTHDSEFLGSMEAFDISGKTPELGLWLKSSAHGKGYGYEALKGLVDHLNCDRPVSVLHLQRGYPKCSKHPFGGKIQL